MKKIIITATAENREQAQSLLDLGVERLYVGDADFGLRLPKPLTHEELSQIAQLAHQAGKAITVAVNALMHQDMMDRLPAYLDFLETIQADYITVGDAGVFYICQRDQRPFKTIYDASTMVTSSRQINFWGKTAGASEAVLAREIPAQELFDMGTRLEIPAEVLVYGASVIHHSKRPLLQNYYNFTKIEDEKTKSRDLFLVEPNDPSSHHSIFEDRHGTHIFANNDLNLIDKLDELLAHGYDHWKLDGLYCPGENFVTIVEQFVKARTLLEQGLYSREQIQLLDLEIGRHHPHNRGLSRGFYDYSPDMVK